MSSAIVRGHSRTSASAGKSACKKSVRTAMDGIESKSISLMGDGTSMGNKRRQQHRQIRDNLLEIDFFTLFLMIWLVINQHVNLVLSDDSMNYDNRSNQLINASVHMINGAVTRNYVDGHTNYVVDDDIEQKKHFTSTWAVRVPGGDDDADRVANEHGFTNLGKVSIIFLPRGAEENLSDRTEVVDNFQIQGK